MAGLHRLEACRTLGHAEIAARVLDLDALGVELVEIDENLVRRELTVLEQAEHLARRDELLRARGERAPDHRPEKGASVAPFQTTKAIAAQVGMSERTAQERMQIVRGLTGVARATLRGTAAANERYTLLTLARVEDAAEQEEIARHLADGRATSVGDARQVMREERLRRANRCGGCGTRSDEMVDGLCPACAATRRRVEARARAGATRAEKEKANEKERKRWRAIERQLENVPSRRQPLRADVLTPDEARSLVTRIGACRGWLDRVEHDLGAAVAPVNGTAT